MDAKKLGTSLILLGIVLLIAAAAWWWHFYSPIADTFHQDVAGRFGSCLYSNGGMCSLASAGAQLAGNTPYSPVLGWAGAASFVLGIMMKLSSR